MTANSYLRPPDPTVLPFPELYRPSEIYDECLTADGAVRPAWRPLTPVLTNMRENDFGRIRERVVGMIDDDGVTYNQLVGAGDKARSVPVRWHLDPLPVVIESDEWEALSRGIAQRSLLLDAVLRDFYGEQRSLRERVVPPEVLFANRGFIRRAVGAPTFGPKSLFLHATDIGRLADGSFAAVADRTQAPSGIGYAIAGRRIMSRALPRMFRATTPRSLTGFAQTLRSSLFEAAPEGVEDPSAVLLSPGPLSETSFDQAYLASLLGIPVVEANDLTVRDGGLYMRSLGRMKRIDVVLRRVDSEFSDPLDLRTDSRLGVVGLVELITRGAVSVVNTLGSGVLETPALLPYLDSLCRALLDEQLLLPSTPTFPMNSVAGHDAVTARLENLQLSHISTGEKIVGADLDSTAAQQLRARISAEPELWTAQELVSFSESPALPQGSTLPQPRGFAIRAFSVAQEAGYAVMGGGLGQVLVEGDRGRRLLSSAARDVWVPTSEATRTGVRVATVPPAPRQLAAAAAPISTPRVLSDQFWIGRYGERAEAMVRTLSVACDRNTDYRNRPWQSGAASLQPWLDAIVAVSGPAVAQIEADGSDADVLAALRKLVLDSTFAGTVAHSYGRLAAGTRSLRDQMSTGTWTVLGGAERALSRLELATEDDGSQLAATLSELLLSLLAFAGLARESMVRDPGWLMMDAGRRLERSLQLVHLTRETVVPVRDSDTDIAMVDSYLVASESSVTYRRRHRSLIRARSAVDLMFFDETNPRSIIYLLTDLRTDLAHLPEELRSGPAERIVDELISHVERFDPDDTEVVEDGRRSELAALLDRLDEGLREASDVLERSRFAPPTLPQPMWYDTVGGS